MIAVVTYALGTLTLKLQAQARSGWRQTLIYNQKQTRQRRRRAAPVANLTSSWQSGRAHHFKCSFERQQARSVHIDRARSSVLWSVILRHRPPNSCPKGQLTFTQDFCVDAPAATESRRQTRWLRPADSQPRARGMNISCGAELRRAAQLKQRPLALLRFFGARVVDHTWLAARGTLFIQTLLGNAE